ncbi:hypothetical protein HPC38_10275 [Pasteurellaceae bacterium HPA106]|uniref:YadA-like family protein n=1 Tax=Spirabiliibacterium pneumoniae TaxID=221400 RepID=UPI001AAD1DE9|nr:YadA-like family protein [Spirabiliibacterium pneumoniae]MBE2897252.1 hypothetical protein [Spirabiliibacterium pneumoniae]
MNINFKVIFNRALGCFVAVSELAKSQHKSGTRGQFSVNRVQKKKHFTYTALSAALLIGLANSAAAVEYYSVNDQNTERADKSKNQNKDNLGASGAKSMAAGYNARAEGEKATAVGTDSYAKSADAVAVGNAAKAEGERAIALGKNAQAKGNNSFAFGENAQAFDEKSFALGKNAQAKKEGSFAIGENAKAEGEKSFALGKGATAKQEGSFALGANAKAGNGATDINNIALGTNAAAYRENSTAIGTSALAWGKNAVALGNDTEANGTSAVAIGDTAKTNGQVESIAIGKGTYTTNGQSIALGKDAKTKGTSSTAIGDTAQADGYSAIAMGQRAYAKGDNTIAVGRDAGKGSNNAHGVTIGYNAGQYIGTDTERRWRNIAIGENANKFEDKDDKRLTTDNNIAMGVNSKASGGDSVGIGTSAYSGVKDAVAIGRNARVSTYENPNREIKEPSVGGVAVGVDAVVGGEAPAGVAVGRKAYANRHGSIAIGGSSEEGKQTNAGGFGSVAIGDDARASGYATIELPSASLTAEEIEAKRLKSASVAIGRSTRANGDAATAIGQGATAAGQGIAIGHKVSAAGNSVVIGNEGQATVYNNQTSPGSAVSLESYGTAVGAGAQVNSGRSVALGINSRTGFRRFNPDGTPNYQGDDGDPVIVAMKKSSLVGEGVVDANKNYSAEMKAKGVSEWGAQQVALGSQITVLGDQSTAIGNDVFALGHSSIAIGGDDTDIVAKTDVGAEYLSLTGKGAGGYRPTATGGMASIAFGVRAVTTNRAGLSTAFGTGVKTDAIAATAIGMGAQGLSKTGVALGATSEATRQGLSYSNDIASRGAVVAKPADVSVSSDKITFKAATPQVYAIKNVTDADKNAILNTTYKTLGAVSLGRDLTPDGSVAYTRQITNVAAGSADYDAVNVAQLRAVANSVGEGSHYYSVNNKDGNGDDRKENNYHNEGALGDRALAAGVNAVAKGDNASAAGNASRAFTSGSVALGNNALAGADMGFKEKHDAAYTAWQQAKVLADEHKQQLDQKTVEEQQLAKTQNSVNIRVSDITNQANSNTQKITDNNNLITKTKNDIIEPEKVKLAGLKQQVADVEQQITTAKQNAQDTTALERDKANLVKKRDDSAAYLAKYEDQVARLEAANAYLTEETGVFNKDKAELEEVKADTDAKLAEVRSEKDQLRQQVNADQADLRNKEKAYKAVGDATGINAIAIGNNAQAAGIDSIVLGSASTVGKDASGSVAIGSGNTVQQENTFVLGKNITSSQANSVIFGNASSDRAATTENEANVNGLKYSGFAGQGSVEKGVVSFGAEGKERQLINVAAGKISADSTDAINGSQLYLTQKVLGNVANSTKNVLGGDAAVSPEGNITMSNIGGTGKNTVDEAIKAAKTEVKAGNNVTVSNEADSADGHTIYTVNAEKTTTSAGSDAVTVQAGEKNEQGVTNYELDLAQTTKDNIQKGVDANKAIETKGVEFMGDTGTKFARKLGEQTNVKGGAVGELTDGNIGVVADGKDTLTIKLAKMVNLTEDGMLMIGDTVMDKEGLSTPEVTADKVNAGKTKIEDGKITGLAARNTDDNDDYGKGNNANRAATESAVSVVNDNVSLVDAKLEAAEFGLKGQDGKEVKKNLNNTIDVVGADDNISTKVDDSKLKIELAKDIKGLNSIEVKGTEPNQGTVINGDTITSTDADSKVANRTPTKTEFMGGDNGKVILSNSGLDNGGNKITNVANGVEPTDAVNMSQLTGVSDKVNKGLSFAGDYDKNGKDDNNKFTQQLGDMTSFEGGADFGDLSDDNIGVVSNGADGLAIKLAKNINLTEQGSVQLGDTMVNNGGLTVKGGPSVTKEGINAADKPISNVGSAIDGKDGADALAKLDSAKNDPNTVKSAVNVSDLANTADALKDSLDKDLTNKGFGLTDDDDQAVKKPLGETIKVNGKNGITVKANDDQDGLEIGIGENLNVGDKVVINGKDGSIGVKGDNGKDGVSLNGKDGSITLNNGKDGKDGASATLEVVNGKPGLNGKDGDTQPRLQVGDKQVATLDDGLLFQGNNKDDAQAPLAKKLNEKLTIKGGNDGANVSDANTYVENNGSELVVKLAKNLTNIDSITTNGGVVINNDGINAGDKAIINVAAGKVSKDSTDAVNGGQLFGVDQKTIKNAEDIILNQEGIKTLQKGWNITTGKTTGEVDGTSKANVQADDTVTVNAGDNIKLVQDGKTLTVATKKDMLLDSAVIGPVVIDKNGIDAGDKLITGVADGKDPQDAVNKRQLDAISADAGDKLADFTVGADKDANADGIVVNKNNKRFDIVGGDSNSITTEVDGNKVVVDLTNDVTIGKLVDPNDPDSKGEAGAVTVTGKDGKNGVSIKGDNGDGKPAITIAGENGANGVSLTTKTDGQPGVNGKDGDTKPRLEVNDEEVATLNDGIKYAGDTGTASTALNKTASIVGGVTDEGKLSDNNIGVVATQDGDNAKLTVKLAKDIKDLDSITTNGGVKIDDKGIDAGNKAITNVASGGDVDTNAANIGDVKKAAAAASSKVEAGDNIVVKSKSNDDGSTTYTVATKKDLDVDSVKAGDTRVNKDGVKVGDKVTLNNEGLKADNVSVTSAGINAGGNKVSGVQNGDISAKSTDAVNGSQLFNQGEGVKNIIGGNTTYDPNTGTFTNADIGGTGKGNINDAIASVNTTSKAAKTEVEAGKNIVVKEPRVGVNGQTIYTVETADKVAFDEVKVGNVAIDNNGINAGNKAIDGVKAGNVTEGSQQAVNGGQLHNTAQSVANALGGGSTVSDNGEVTAPSYELTGTDGKKETAHSVGGALNFFTSQVVKPITFAGNEGSHTAQLGSTVQITGADSNISTKVEGNNVKIRLADNLNVKSVTAGNTKVDKAGVTIKSAQAGNVSLGAYGLNNGGNTITNVADGVKDSDVATVRQVKGVAQQVNKNTQAINNLGNRMNNMDRKLKGGIAGNSAMASLPQAYIPGHSMVAVAGGHYSGKSAVALGVSRISDSGHVIIKLNAATNSSGGTNVGAGVGYQW